MTRPLKHTTAKVETEVHTVFGWKVVHHTMPVGATMVTYAAEPVPRDRSPNRAMYVAGKAEVVGENDKKHTNRVAGMFSQERPDYPAGMTTVTAITETEFWCFNYTHNRRALPELTPVRLQAGQTHELNKGDKLFVMKGTAGDLIGPMCYTAPKKMTLTADTRLFAFIIAKERDDVV